MNRLGWALLLMGLSLLPDADVLAFSLGIPYGAPFGHRGAAHSLMFAAAVASVAWVVTLRLDLPGSFAALVGAVVASHGLLDTLTDGGRGIALLWPFTNVRYFAPWRPLAVAPIGLRVLTPSGLRLMLHEVVWFLPFLVIAFWPSRDRTSRGA